MAVRRSLTLFVVDQARRHATVTPHASTISPKPDSNNGCGCFCIHRGTGLCIARPIHLVCSAVWYGDDFVAVASGAIPLLNRLHKSQRKPVPAYSAQAQGCSASLFYRLKHTIKASPLCDPQQLHP